MTYSDRGSNNENRSMISDVICEKVLDGFGTFVYFQIQRFWWRQFNNKQARDRGTTDICVEYRK